MYSTAIGNRKTKIEVERGTKRDGVLGITNLFRKVNQTQLYFSYFEMFYLGF